ncbi:MAG: stress response translation initiation inhibitor YciH [Candidatus Nezhaarchaeales archaeon]|nr:MAG: stress response translation initiation inhibitor YciH [Candidatus Nezhaarchaeota archaeon WYZ-LMO8]TDA37430.1 MAG: stress response translation initiation inhibitor YciH [Candidatus Nezhaarchaeota archaeon WYZ-LMO7]
MNETCPVCGLPRDLCVCEAIDREQQFIRIYIEKRKWGREVTVIEGISEKSYDLKSIAGKLKSACACGGTAKNGKIELQGDHRHKAREVLVEMGFPPENISVE